MRSKIGIVFMAAMMVSVCVGRVNVLASTLQRNEQTISGDVNNESVYIPTLEEEQVIEENKQLVEYELSIQENRSSQGVKVVLPVKVFTQDNEYYCGPATVKQTLHYRNGSSLGQKNMLTY